MPSPSSQSSSPLRFALIGHGGIAQEILRLAADEPRAACVALLVRPERRAALQAALPAGRRAVDTAAALLSEAPDLVLDCAGHGALRQYGEAVLRGGADLVTVSSGALADPALEASLRAAEAAPGAGALVVAAGALAGVDGLAAARHAGLDRVRYRGIKPPRAWRGTPAEALLDLEALSAPATFFRGTAREAASRYPANANVTATLALAGLGFERTEVELVADPAATQNIHQVSYAGAFGEASVEIRGRPSAANPRTSMLTALSVWQCLAARLRPAA